MEKIVGKKKAIKGGRKTDSDRSYKYGRKKKVDEKGKMVEKKTNISGGDILTAVKKAAMEAKKTVRKEY